MSIWRELLDTRFILCEIFITFEADFKDLLFSFCVTWSFSVTFTNMGGDKTLFIHIVNHSEPNAVLIYFSQVIKNGGGGEKVKL